MDLLPTHPTPEMTHAVETILDYGCDWTYIVENNLVSKTDPHPNPNLLLTPILILILTPILTLTPTPP